MKKYAKFLVAVNTVVERHVETNKIRFSEIAKLFCISVYIQMCWYVSSKERMKLKAYKEFMRSSEWKAMFL